MNGHHARSVIVLLTVPLAAPRLAAQMAAPTHFVAWRPDAADPVAVSWTVDSEAPTPNGSGMILGGITGFFIGYSIGGLVGAALAHDDDDLAAAVFGGAVVSSLTIPVGVHLGNRSRGNVLSDLLISAAIGAAGIGIATATNDGTPLLVTSLAQVITSIWMEERSMHEAIPPDASH
jgi:hypothetical protein